MNTWIKNYKKLNSFYLIKKLEGVRFKLLNFSKLVSKDAKILDIGCGSGYSLKTLDNLGYKNLWGLDIDNIIDPNYTFIKFIKGSIATKSSIKDNEFDVVYTFAVLHHLKNKSELESALVEINRILKNGGYVFNYEPSNNIFGRFEEHFFTFKPLHFIPLIRTVGRMIEAEKTEIYEFRKNIKLITPFYRQMRMKKVIDKSFLCRHLWCFQKSTWQKP